MNNRTIATLIGTTLIGTLTAAIGLISTTGQAAQAGVLHNGWNYALDSISDALPRNSDWELYGIAIKEDAGQVYVAINGRFPLSGIHDYRLGDLFFNFSGSPFIEASNNQSLYAISFSDYDGKPNGVYAGVYPTKLSQSFPPGGNINLEYEATYNDINIALDGRKNMGDLSATDHYFAPTDSRIVYGFEAVNAQLVGSINHLNQTDLLALNLDIPFFVNGTRIENNPGNQTFGFSFDSNLLPQGNYIAHLLENCGNDGVAIAITSTPPIKSTPEPSTMVGIIGIGLTFAGTQLYKRRQGTR